jgi:predicted N-acetyltransferase YhbS
MDAGPARPDEHPAVHAMGHDTWGGGLDLGAFLDLCQASAKYAGGRWFVIRDEGEAVSSLLVHDFESWNGMVVRGVGSLATRPDRRREGWAGCLLEHVFAQLVERERASVVFLYADIAPGYYARRGFQVVDTAPRGADGAVLMVRFTPEVDMAVIEEDSSRLPRYF